MTAALIAATSALATYPGANGKLGLMHPVGGAFYDDIFSIDLDGSRLANLTHNGANNVQFKWSPDGRKIAFTSDGDGLDNAYDLYIVNADGSGLRKVSDTGERQGLLTGRPTARRSSSRTEATTGHSGRSMPTERACGRSPTACILTCSPAWSPDGRKIAVEKEIEWPTIDIYTMNPDGTGETRITDTPLGEGHPVWSPDSKKVAFVAGPSPGASPAAVVRRSIR